MWSQILPYVQKLGEHITAWGVVLGGAVVAFTTVGWDLPPYASMDSVQAVQQDVSAVKVTGESSACVLLDVQRTTLKMALRNAEADLKKNPESDSAKNAISDAKESLRANRKNIQALGSRCPI